MTLDPIAVPRSWLPCITISFLVGKEAVHNDGDCAAMDNENGVLIGGLNVVQCLADTAPHLPAAFTIRREVCVVVARNPTEIGYIIFQLFIGFHFKNSKVEFTKARIRLVRNSTEEDLECLLRPNHAAGYKPAGYRRMVMQMLQFFHPSGTEGEIRGTAVEVLFIGVCFSVSNQIKNHKTASDQGQYTDTAELCDGQAEAGNISIHSLKRTIASL